MKTLKYILCACALIAGMGIADAATSKEKLITSLYRDQKKTEKQIIKLWMNNKRGKELEELLAEYVTREVRLQAMTGKMDTRTLLAKVTKNGEHEFKTPVELARAIMLEHLKTKDIDLKDCTYVKGEYMIRKSCLD